MFRLLLFVLLYICIGNTHVLKSRFFKMIQSHTGIQVFCNAFGDFRSEDFEIFKLMHACGVFSDVLPQHQDCY